MAVTALSYVIASILLFIAAFFFAPRDTEKLRLSIAAKAPVPVL